jgi:hypothetical protein
MQTSNDQTRIPSTTESIQKQETQKQILDILTSVKSFDIGTLFRKTAPFK